MTTPGRAYVTSYRIDCGCECGCCARFELAGGGGGYSEERRAFDEALAEAGWEIAPNQPRWRCKGCLSCWIAGPIGGADPYGEPVTLELRHGMMVQQADGRVDVLLEVPVFGGFVMTCRDCGSFGPCAHGGAA